MTATDIQRSLSALGYTPGRIDGVLGVRSRAALKAFLVREGVTSTSAEGQRGVLAAALEREQNRSADSVLLLNDLRRILAARHARTALDDLYSHLQWAMVEACISATAHRQAHFLAQLFHESGGLLYMEEIADGDAYEGRADLGNTRRGDGRRYKGRGPIQLTGRANYRRYGNLLGLDLEGQPELAAEPSVGFRVAALYWTDNNLNAVADRAIRDPEAAFLAITKAINGGVNGLEDRRQWLGACWGVITARS